MKVNYKMRWEIMAKIKMVLEAVLEDVNQEDGYTLRVFEKITNFLFSFIKWGGIPFVIYLLFEISRW